MCAGFDARKTARKSWLLGLLLFVGRLAQAGLSPEEAGVKVWATIAESPPEIRLNWTRDTTAVHYEISRKQSGATNWAVVGATGGGATNWLDTNAVAGIAFEYLVSKDTGIPGLGYGYICAGIRVPVVESRGKMILLVERSLGGPLAFGLARLQQDLAGDGWTVIRHDVGATDAPPTVKALVKADYLEDPVNVKGLFLFGHVPVPYSGFISPDGHEDHRGAWPADVYYGEFDGAWTDSSVTATNVAHPLNKNVPGDGKFDQSAPPGPVRLQIGRVDLSNLTCFANKTPPRSEVDLARQYLNKDHAFRHGQLNVARRALIYQNWGGQEDEPMYAMAMRSFPSFFGLDQLKGIGADEFFPDANTNSYTWGFVSSSGGETFVNGVGSADAFALNDPKVIFTSFMGSYFGDWDRESNFLRAALGSSTHLLTSVYGGQPQWILHTMSLGDTIGQAALLTQNNGTNGIYIPHRNFGVGQVHISLLGDPSLRMFPVLPPGGVTGEVVANGMQLRWMASEDSGLAGYRVYRAESAAGPFSRISGQGFLSGTNFTDATAPANAVYMVRAIKLDQNPAGTFFNASQGVFFPDGLTSGTVAAPTGVGARIEAGAVVIYWTDTTGAASSFQIERRPLAGGGFQSVGSASGFENSFSDSSVQPERYVYRVKALGSEGAVAISAEAPINVQPGWALARGIDAGPGGNWIGTYGQEGYVVYDAATNLPPNVRLSLSTATRFIGESHSDDRAALLRSDGSDGIYAYRLSWTPLEFQIEFADDAAHQVAIYHVDDFEGRAEVINPLTGQVLAGMEYGGSTNGAYLLFDVRNTVTMRFTPATNNAATVSGLFIAGAALPPPGISPVSGNFAGRTNVTMQSVPGASIHYTTDGSDPDEGAPLFASALTVRSNALIKARAFLGGYPATAVASVSLTNSLVTAAVFKLEDTTTRGDWFRTYGQEGSWFGSYVRPAAAFCDFSLNNAPYFLWSDTTTEFRALNKNTRANGRVASCWSGSEELVLNLDLYVDQLHKVALYFLDWDDQGRVLEVTMTDPAGVIVDQRTVQNFRDGKYLVWDAMGSARISIRRVAGPNAIVNGVFIGPAPINTEPAQLATVLVASGSQFQLRVMGQPGQTFDVQYTTNLQAWITFRRYTLTSPMADWTFPIANQPGLLIYRAVQAAPSP